MGRSQGCGRERELKSPYMSIRFLLSSGSPWICANNLAGAKSLGREREGGSHRRDRIQHKSLLLGPSFPAACCSVLPLLCPVSPFLPCFSLPSLMCCLPWQVQSIPPAAMQRLWPTHQCSGNVLLCTLPEHPLW